MAEIGTIILGLLNAPAIIKKYVTDPLKIQFNYLCRSESIRDSLRAKVDRLEITANNLQSDVSVAERNLEIIRTEVRDWLKSAAEIKEEARRVFQDRPEVQDGCINGICSNLKLRYSASRDAMEMAKAVVALGDGKFEVIADPAPPPGREIIPVLPGTEFESRKTKEEEIMAALRDNSIYLIGVCGMGGVGKTTMVEKIWKRAKEEEKLFDVVAMAVVSQQLDEKGIQKQIAKFLGLELKEDETVSISAGRLRTRLGQETSILIIIDDIWEALNPVKLGIPSPREHKGCKIILTSRNHGVCTRTEATEMNETKIVSLDVLTENEAWALFKAKAGTVVDRCDLHQIAKNVAKECKGLPLALVTVGSAMAETDAQENPRPVWEDALVQLQRSAPSDIEGVLEKVYRPLEWSYNHLKSDEARYLFLLCCLFPEDSPISLIDLLYYGVGLRIFSNVETLGEARNRVYALVGRLESRYMLMDGGTMEGIKCVKMHDVIRDVAIYIASTGKHVFMTSHGLKDWPRKDSYESYTHISITLEKRVTLPDCINFPRLKMLRMEFHLSKAGRVPDTFSDRMRGQFLLSKAGRVPDTFFDRMRELNVLDIKCIGSLPPSLQLLTNLRTLRLRGSYLETVSTIGQLVKLEILDLRCSSFTELPKEIGGLENLKSLDLCWCSDLEEIAPGVISRLVRLEELFVLDSFKNWEAEVEGKERRNASLVELASLENLTTLHLQVPDPKVLPLHWPELESSVLWIGRESPDNVRGKEYGDKSLILDLNETTPLVHAIIRKADRLNLTLRGMCASDELIKSIQERNEHLKLLKLSNCHNMKYLADRLSKENNIFPKLRYLSLSNCRDLEGISSVRPSLCGSFDALNVLKLSDLCKLTHFWDQKLCLPNLREVDIMDCSNLQCVFLQSTAESADVVGPIEFPNLTELSLSMLPSFNSFWKADNGIESLHKFDNQFLFNQKVTFPSLEKLGLCEIETATKIFSSQIQVASFSRLLKLQVDSCPNLKVIFSPPAFRNFRELRKLEVFNCSKLEEVIGNEDKELQAAVKEPLFPELKKLKLSILPNLKTFCHMKNDIELPNLESIAIKDCEQMEKFSLRSPSLPSMENDFGLLDLNLATQIFFNREVFASLVEMELSNINATKIFSPVAYFSQLQLLQINSCSNLKVIFSPPSFRNFRRLRALAVFNCSKLEEVIGKENEELQPAVKEPLFPELKKLILSKLSNFKTFCHMKNDVELPQLERITIEDCHEMGTFSLGSLSLPSMQNVFGLLDPNLATQIFFNREVFASLMEMEVSNVNATKIFSSQIPVASFSQLQLLQVHSCPNLQVIFSPPAFRNFRTLCKLEVVNCSKLEGVVGKEDEELQAGEPLFPELKELILSKLPNFKTFCHMKNDVELPQLESITIEDCHEMETFSLGSLSLPRLAYVFGLLEPDLATRIIFKKETPRHEIRLKNDSFTLSAKELLGFEYDDYKGNCEWFLANDSSGNFFIVARIHTCTYLKISGRFVMVKLSPKTLYEVVFEIKLEESHFHCLDPVDLKLTQSEDIPLERCEYLEHQPRGEWIEILAGEFTTGPDPIGELEFSLYCCYVDGIFVKGAKIRPKA